MARNRLPICAPPKPSSVRLEPGPRRARPHRAGSVSSRLPAFAGRMCGPPRNGAPGRSGECRRSLLIHAHSRARAVPEDEPAVLDDTSTVNPVGGVEVLELGGHVVRHRGRRVHQAQRRRADRADRQVVGVGQRGHPQEVRDPPPGAVWTTSSAPAARSGRNCSSPVRFSPAATDARIAASDRHHARRRPSGAPAPRPRSGRRSAPARRRGARPACGSRTRWRRASVPAAARVGLGEDVADDGRAAPGPGRRPARP